MRSNALNAPEAEQRALGSQHYVALALLATHAIFLMLVLTVVETSKGLSENARGLVELGVTAALGLGMIFFFLYSKWISPAKGNALIQVVNVALGTLLFTLFFPEQGLQTAQWVGVVLCCAGIAMMISRGSSAFFLFPARRPAAQPSSDLRGAAGAEAISPRASLARLGAGVAIGFALWVFWVDFSAFEGGWSGFTAVLSDRDNALALFAFEVAATTLTPLAAKIAVSQTPTTRVVVSAASIALLGVSLYFYFHYSDHISIHKSNAVLQTVNTLVGTLLVAGLYSDERLSARQWAGAAFCALGIALTLNLFAGEIDFFREAAAGATIN